MGFANGTVLALLAQGRGEDVDGGIGVVYIVAIIVVAALTIAVAATLVIRRSRRAQSRAGPERHPHRPGHAGRVTSMRPGRSRK